MTEADWWAATEPEDLINFLFYQADATDRKLRLFSVACCRRVAHWANDEELFRLLSCSESFADGATSEAELADTVAEVKGRYESVTRSPDALHVVCAAWNVGLVSAEKPQHYRDLSQAFRFEMRPNSWWIVQHIAGGIIEPPVWTQQGDDPRVSEWLHQTGLLHDIFGPLPFRDVPVSPGWLTSTVVALARGIYDEKAFDRMPILADALQDAGCDNDEMLNHCRAESWEHVRGCWVLDLLLGRPWRSEGVSG